MLQLGIATFSGIDETGFIAVQIDAFGENKSGVSPYPLSHSYGFAARPLPLRNGKGCGTYYWQKGSSEGFAWLANDPLVQALLPEIQPGESFHYGPTGQFVRCHADGRISIFTTDDATPNGRSVYSQVGPKGFTRVAPWGRETFDPNGFHLLHVSGARIDLGAVGGLPVPLDALNSYVTLSAQMLRLEGAVVSIGPADGVGMPAAKATIAQASDTEIVVAIDAIMLALEALTAALGAVGALTTSPAAASSAVAATTAPIAGAQAAVVAAAAAVNSAIATMPSSVMVS